MKNSKIVMLKAKINELIKQKMSVQEEVLYGMIDTLTAKAKEELLSKEIIEKKKLLVQEVHIGKRGNLLSMGKYNEQKGLYIVKCVDGKQLTSVSQEGLLDAMMEHYGLSLASPLVKEIFTRAIEKYEHKHPDANRTVINLKYDYKRFIEKDFATKDIRKITLDWLEDYTLSFLKSKNVKVSALRAYKTLLNLIFEHAIFEGFIVENVAKGVKLKDYARYCDQSLSHRKSEDVLLSNNEEQQILDFMYQKIEKGCTTYGYAPYAFMTLLHTQLGCRPDELICIKWSDIDFERKNVYIERQQLEKRNPRLFVVVEYTKNERGVSKGGRIVPLSNSAIELLELLKEAKNRENIFSDWLFSDREGNVLRKSNYCDFVRESCIKIGIESRGTYAFRRGLSAKMERNAIPASVRAKILGHSIETNLKNYTFAPVDYLETVRNVLN